MLFKSSEYLIILTILTIPVYTVLPTPQAEYVYYGVIPERTYQYVPVEETDLSKGWMLLLNSITDHGYISILALQDNTYVRVYTLPSKELVSEATLNRMQKNYVRLPNGTMFKIISNNLVSVTIISPPPRGGIPGVNATESPGVLGFYTSVEGAYVGREFMIEASQGLVGFGYMIFALEDAKVTLTDEKGETQSYDLKANSFKELMLKPLTAYRIVSTGNIMIQAGTPTLWGSRSFFIPSAEGGFIGRRFYTRTSQTFDIKEENFFIISAVSEDSKVTIWDLSSRKVVSVLNVRVGEPVSAKLTAVEYTPGVAAIMFDSDNPIVVQYLHSGNIRRSYGLANWGVGFTYMSIRPGEDTPFMLPTNSTIYTYLFVSEEASILIDDIPITVRPDEPFIINTPGPHVIRSNKNLVLLLLHYPLTPPNQGINGFGVPVPCVQTVSVTPSVTLYPISREGFTISPVNYVIIIIIVVLAVAVAGILLLRKRKKK
ncbi:MAG: hypothetical protein QXT26_00990 [Thermoproteota archaeon]